MDKYLFTVITPTTGKESLFFLINSLKQQNMPISHILLWDNQREGRFANFDPVTLSTQTPTELDCVDPMYKCTNIVINDDVVKDYSVNILRSIGLMSAMTEFVTFADDNVVWENNHASTIINSIGDKKWGYSNYKVWKTAEDNQFEYIGTDKNIDNNALFFRRRFGSSASCIYRETKNGESVEMFQFLTKHAGLPCVIEKETLNVVKG